MINELSFTHFKSTLLDAFRGKCEYDSRSQFTQAWFVAQERIQNSSLSNPIEELREAMFKSELPTAL